MRRLNVVQALARTGLSIEDLARLIRSYRLSLEFIDHAATTVFAALSDTTFAELSERTGIAVEMLTVPRDVTGGKTAGPGDRVREDELEILPLVQYQLQLRFRRQAIERGLRAAGDSIQPTGSSLSAES